jgi:hypothetical protein
VSVAHTGTLPGARTTKLPSDYIRATEFGRNVLLDHTG